VKLCIIIIQGRKYSKLFHLVSVRNKWCSLLSSLFQIELEGFPFTVYVLGFNLDDDRKPHFPWLLTRILSSLCSYNICNHSELHDTSNHHKLCQSQNDTPPLRAPQIPIVTVGNISHRIRSKTDHGPMQRSLKSKTNSTSLNWKADKYYRRKRDKSSDRKKKKKSKKVSNNIMVLFYRTS
jgi:hypothetical protein